MHEYPHTINNPRGGRITINDESDLIELFKSFLFDSKGKLLNLPDETFYSFVKQSICPNRLRDPWADAVIARYFYCQQFGIQPYPGGYDDQPAYWLNISRFIQATIDEIRQCKCNIHAT